MSILYTSGVFTFLITTVIQVQQAGMRKALIFGGLSLLLLGHFISQAIALSTSSTTSANNTSLSFDSSADVWLFETASQASLALAITLVALIILYHIGTSKKSTPARTALILAACIKLLIQFSLSFQPPTYSLVLARKLLDFFAFLTLALEAVYVYVRLLGWGR